MQIEPSPLSDAYVIRLEKFGDDRGFFARLYCSNEFSEAGLVSDFVQVNNSLTAHRGTLRGMHFQIAPHQETKLVRCIKGAFYDVIVDLRPESDTYKQHFGIELSADNRTMLYVPKGFAHSFLTLTDDAEALYFVDEFYAPEAERGLRWNDPEFAIDWPIEPTVISEKDASWPDFDPSYHAA